MSMQVSHSSRNKISIHSTGERKQRSSLTKSLVLSVNLFYVAGTAPLPHGDSPADKLAR